jgi:hypothetical protein
MSILLAYNTANKARSSRKQNTKKYWKSPKEDRKRGKRLTKTRPDGKNWKK